MLEEREIEIEVAEGGAGPSVSVFTPQGVEELGMQFRDLLGSLFPGQRKRRRMPVREARRVLLGEEAARLVDADRVRERSREELIAELGLTDQELEVLELMVQGYRYEEIARRLFLSKSRIKQTASSICRKLKARDKAHACALAVHMGLVTSPPKPSSGLEGMEDEEEEI